MPEIVLEARGLRRTFASLVAVDSLDLTVERQQFYGFLGPNGAGKSTTIKMLTGLLRPTSGEIRIFGLGLENNSVEVKRRIGVVPEGLALFERLSGSQLLNFVGRMYGLDRTTATQRTDELLDFMGLTDSADKLVADYSHGMKKKTALAAAVIHRPEMLFLDEPFEGVDAIAATTLFLSPSWPRRILRLHLPAVERNEPVSQRKQTLVLSLAAIYVAFQILVPLRNFIHRGGIEWSCMEHRFSWQMMLHRHTITTYLYVTDRILDRMFR